MAEFAVIEKNRRFYFNWVVDVFFHPRRIFQRISTSSKAIWLTPLLILSFFALANVLIAGRLKSQAALTGEITFPPDYQYYTPERQAQYMQAIQATQGPVFVYVLPAITTILGVWIGWLILSGILHFATTLLGGRGSTSTSMNIVAWGSLPVALRSLIQVIYMLVTNKMINNAGLSGFSPTGESGWAVFLGLFLRLLDIYLIWQILLLILGIRLSTGLNVTKSSTGVILTVVIMLLLQTGLSYMGNVLGNLTITRPFFF